MKSLYNFITEKRIVPPLFDDLLSSLQKIENEQSIYLSRKSYDRNLHINYFLGSIEQLAQRYTNGSSVSEPGDPGNGIAKLYLDIIYLYDASNIQIGFLLDGSYDFNYNTRPASVLISSTKYSKLYNKYFKSLTCIDTRKNIYELNKNTEDCLINFCQDLKNNKKEIIQAMKEVDPYIARKYIKQSELKPIVEKIESILT